MKHKILSTVIVAAITFIGGWNYNQSKNETILSELALANIEALASDESSGCTVRVSCGSNINDYVECSGSTCEREDTTFSRWVKCDGEKTSC